MEADDLMDLPEKTHKPLERRIGVQHDTQALEHETQIAAQRATLFDAAEVFLEIAIVLSSIALMTGSSRFWLISFVGAAIGAVASIMAFIPR